MDDPLDPAVTEMINEVMHTYKYIPTSELKLTSPFRFYRTSGDCHTFQVSFLSAMSTHGMQAGVVVQAVFISYVLFSLYVNNMPTCCHHVEYIQCVDRMVLVAMFCSP
jgi:hypothetical protein